MSLLTRSLRVLCLPVLGVLAGHILWWAAKPAVREAAAGVRHGTAPAGGWTLDRLVTDAAACGAITVFALLAVSGTVTVCTGLTHRPAGRLLIPLSGPGWWRRMVLSACGLGLAVPAVTSTGFAIDEADQHPCPPECTTSLSGLRLPDLPARGSPQPTLLAHAASTPTASSDATPLTVRPGDSLWAIASQQLGQASSDADIARRVVALYRLNRSIIGPDPDLIFPGTQLFAPGGNHDIHP